MSQRYRLRARDLDEFGVLKAEALRALARALWDTPADMPVVIDLGPILQVQDQLIRDLSLYRCAFMIRFEARDWRSVRDHTRALAKALGIAA